MSRATGRGTGGRRALVPHVPAITIRRDRLLRLLDASTPSKVVLVVAPTGTGKSVLLTQWADAHRRRDIRWLTLTAADDDHVRFSRTVQRLLDGDGDTRSRARATGPVHLIVDDAHLITNVRMFDELAALVEAAPSVHLILAARSDPAFPLSRFRLRGQLTEVRQRDLAFNRREAHALLEQLAGRPLEPAHVAVLHTATGGGATGLHLAGVCLARVDDDAAFVRACMVDDRPIVQRLNTSFLRLQDDETRRFLLGSSVLPRLCASLCNRALEIDDAALMLEGLERAGMATRPVGEQPGWLRYCGLFRALLRQHLRLEDRDLEREVLDRAARWHLAHDNVADAVSLLVESGATATARHVIRERAPALLRAGRPEEVVRWLELLPARVRAQDDTLALLELAGRIEAGQRVEPGRLLNERGATAPSGRDAATQDGLRASWLLERGHAREALEAARSAQRTARSVGPGTEQDRSEIPGLDQLLQHEAVFTGALAQVALGRLEPALAALHSLDTQLSPHLGIETLGAAAVVNALMGRLGRALGYASRALALAAEAGLATSSLAPVAVLAQAIVAREQGKVDEAAGLLASLHGQLANPILFADLLELEVLETSSR